MALGPAIPAVWVEPILRNLERVVGCVKHVLVVGSVTTVLRPQGHGIGRVGQKVGVVDDAVNRPCL